MLLVMRGGGAVQAGITSVTSATNHFSLNNNGVIGGGQVGYIHNFHNLVAGLETDIQGIESKSQSKTFISSAINSESGISTITTSTVSKRIDYLGTLRGRLGYLITPTLLISGTGGVSYGGVGLNTNISQNVDRATSFLQSSWGTTGHYSNARVGWTAGGTLEWVFQSNWSTKIEYLYYDLGKVTQGDGQLSRLYSAFIPGHPVGSSFFTNGVSTTTHFNGQLVRVGLNYHFA